MNEHQSREQDESNDDTHPTFFTTSRLVAFVEGMMVVAIVVITVAALVVWVFQNETLAFTIHCWIVWLTSAVIVEESDVIGDAAGVDDDTAVDKGGAGDDGMGIYVDRQTGH